jgi:hypothetical protein
MARGPAGSISDAGGEDWVAAYNAVMSRGPAETGKKPGPGCCSVCCTGFSIFAALFLFILASLMKNDYPYLHIEGACAGQGAGSRSSSRSSAEGARGAARMGPAQGVVDTRRRCSAGNGPLVLGPDGRQPPPMIRSNIFW